MKLRLTLILFCLLGIGLFAKAQDKKKNQSKPTVENGADAIPVIVKSNKKARHPKPPPPPPMIGKNDETIPPPKIEVTKFDPPVINKDVKKLSPAPPPAKPLKTKAETPAKPEVPALPEINDLSYLKGL